ncbi:MAG: PQQ-binding-like beta-propeller repeat protein [bacterium]
MKLYFIKFIRTIILCVSIASLVICNLVAFGFEKSTVLTDKTDWNQWRGPNRNGIAPDSPKLIDAWGPSGPVLMWKSEDKITGGPKKGGSFSNYGSPVVARGKVYLYVHDQAIAADKVFCLDANTGKTLWKVSYPGSPDGGGSSTPYVGDGKVYAVGTRGLYCLDAETGKEVWKTPSIVQNAKDASIDSSPVLVDGVLVVIAGSGKHLNQGAKDPNKESGLLKGFDPATGKERWACPQATADANRNGDKSASVAVWKTPNGPRIITGVGKLTCVNPKDGSVIWQDGGGIYGSTSTPAIVGDICVLGTKMKGYRLGPNKAEELFAVAVGGRVESYVLHDGHVYADCYGVYRCIDLTGKVLWQKSTGGKVSSPIFADGKIFHVVSDKGKLAMFNATPTMPETFFEASIPVMSYTSPAISDGKLFVRLVDGMACYDLTKIPADAVKPVDPHAHVKDPAVASMSMSKSLITFVDVSPSYFVQRKGIADQVWPPENEAKAATLDWAINKPLDTDGWIDFIALQDSRGEMTNDCIAYSRVMLEAKAPGKLTLSLTVNKAKGDVSAIVAWVNGMNVLRQNSHEQNPEHVELVVDLVAGKNILLIRTYPTRGHEWKLQIQATAPDGLVVRQVSSTSDATTNIIKNKL